MKIAVTGPRIDIPKLPHRPIWSHQPRTRGGGSSSVSGASMCGSGSTGRSTVAVMATPSHRHYPAGDAVGGRTAALSARCFRAPACLRHDSTPTKPSFGNCDTGDDDPGTDEVVPAHGLPEDHDAEGHRYQWDEVGDGRRRRGADVVNQAVVD